MNKSDLVDYVADATNEGKSKVASLLDALLSGVAGALQKGDKVTLPGFGTFQTRKRQARSGRNPRTGAPVKIAATTVPVFKAGATLKESVAGKKTSGRASAKSKAAAKSSAKASTAKSKAAAKSTAKPSAKGTTAKPKAAAKSAGKPAAAKKTAAKPAAKAAAAKPAAKAKAAPKRGAKKA
jgi:DNA-binding protein HU-beta